MYGLGGDERKDLNRILDDVSSANSDTMFQFKYCDRLLTYILRIELVRG